MVYTEHTPVKAEKIVGIAAAALEQSLVLPNVFVKQGIDQFKGAKDDTINIVVPNVLPYRTYGWRNDRSQGLKYDTYSERKVARTFGDDIYSAVKMTPEQALMDFDGFAALATAQTDAIARGVAVKSTRAVEDAPYEVRVTLAENNLRGSLVRLKSIMDKLRVPGSRTLFVDDELEIALLDDDKLNLEGNVGINQAESALTEASLGRKYKFDFVRGDELVDGSFALFSSGFTFVTAAPPVPPSAGFGASASAEGVALTWTKGWDIDFQVEKSVFMAYHSFDYVKDFLLTYDENDQMEKSDTEHFVRGVKVELGSTFDVEIDNAELASATRISSTDGTNDGA